MHVDRKGAPTLDVKPRLIDSQNRVAIPQEVLKHLRLKAGDYVALVIVDGEVVLRRVKWVAEK